MDSNFPRCIPFLVVGAVLLAIGVPLMITGIVGGFQFSDLIGYIGGAVAFFGLLFLFVWYVVTLPTLEKKKNNLVLGSEKETRKSRKRSADGHSNHAFVVDPNDPIALKLISKVKEPKLSFSGNIKKENPLRAIPSVELDNPDFSPESESTAVLNHPNTELNREKVRASGIEAYKKRLETISENNQINADKQEYESETGTSQEKINTHLQRDVQQSKISNNDSLLRNNIFLPNGKPHRTLRTREVTIASVSWAFFPVKSISDIIGRRKHFWPNISFFS